MESGTISEWLVKEGDFIAEGDALASVATDKANVDFVSTEEGYIAKILVPTGAADVPIGTVVALMVSSKEDVAKMASFSAEDLPESASPPPPPAAASSPPPPPSSPPPAATAPPASPARAAVPPSSSSGRVAASPAARKAAQDHGLDLAKLAGRGTGYDGLVIKADVEEFLAAAPAMVAHAGASALADPSSGFVRGTGFFDLPHTDNRQRTAALLSESKKQVPHYYLTSEICLDELIATRARLNARRDAEDALSVMDFVVKAAAIASKRVPEANSAWLPHAIRTFEYVDVAVTTNTDAGLVTPVVRDAHAKGAADISAELRRLAAAARGGTLTQADAAGATITITNLGAYGVRQAAPIIHPPQAAHLALGAATLRVVPSKDGAARAWEKSMYLNATLSCDHRVLDGAVGSQWLAHFKSLLEDPATMLL
jgi:pyruvate dehydrogenase E2 component (dihydrolipoamide acetyltransferase)